MSLKSKVLAGAATLTLVGSGVGLATAGAAHAATPSCGDACVNIFSDVFGDPQTGHPAFLMDSFKQGVATGTPIILFRESNNDPAEDFVFEDQGTVADFNAAGLISNATFLHYGGGSSAPNSFNLEAFEVEYAPYGASTGQCVGVAATATAGEKVTLQPCGVSAKTVWIVDLVDGLTANHPFGNGVPLINGSNMNFSHPFVLTYPSSGYPTDQPRPVLFTSNLSGHFEVDIFQTPVSLLSADINANQLWDALMGTIQI